MTERVGWACSWHHSKKIPVFSSKTNAAVMKADRYLRLEVRAGMTHCAVWDLVQEETGV